MPAQALAAAAFQKRRDRQQGHPLVAWGGAGPPSCRGSRACRWAEEGWRGWAPLAARRWRRGRPAAAAMRLACDPFDRLDMLDHMSSAWGAARACAGRAVTPTCRLCVTASSRVFPYSLITRRWVCGLSEDEKFARDTTLRSLLRLRGKNPPTTSIHQCQPRCIT